MLIVILQQIKERKQYKKRFTKNVQQPKTKAEKQTIHAIEKVRKSHD